MTAVTQAEFARTLNVNRSAITRWKQAGRLVMQGDLVNVESSKALLAQTADPNRDDVAERHAAYRAQRDGSPPPAPSAPQQAATIDENEEGGGLSYQAARAVKEKYAALKARADYEQQIGSLLAREDVDAAVKFIGAATRSRLLTLADRLAPIVTAIQVQADAHAEIDAEVRNVLTGLAADTARQIEALKGEQ
jgi:hypothetical protein